MPMYEIALPPGAENIRIKTSTQEIPIEPTFYRHSKDGAIPIVALFGGDEFVGEVLEGQWKKGDDGSIQGPFTAKLNGSGSLELTGRSDSAGTFRRGWISSSSQVPILDDLKIDIHMKLSSLTASDEVDACFLLTDDNSGNPEVDSHYLQVRIVAFSDRYAIQILKKTSGTRTWLVPTTTVSNQEGTFRIKFEENKSGHYHTHIYFHDGSGSVNEETDEVSGSPFTLDLPIENAYAHFVIATSETTNRTVSSDFVRVTYPDFKVVYDLDDDAYRGEGEELLKWAWDTSGNGNHGVVHGAIWRRNGKFGKCLEFDGEDYVEVPSINSDFMTISIWLKPKTIGAVKGIIDGSGSANLDVYMNASGYLYLYTTNTDDSRTLLISNVPLIEGEWRHLVLLFGDGLRAIYLNGTLVAQDSATAKTLKITEIGESGSFSYFWEGYIDEVRIYNRALSESEIQTLYNGGEVTDGLVGEWKFDGGSDRAEVKVYDTNNSDDESNWTRVFDVNHQFVGDCVVENGLVRFKVELETDTFCQWGFWNGTSWSMYGVNMPSGYRKARDFKVLSIKPESVAVQFKSLCYYAPDSLCKVELKRGEPFIRITPISGKEDGIFYWHPSCRFFYGQQTDVIDDNLQTGWQNIYRGSDNFVLRLSNSQEFFVPEFRTRNQLDRKGATIYGGILGIQIAETVYIGVLNFAKYANLFKEAEDATLSAGAAIDTTQTDDSGDSVVLDAESEYARYTFTGLTDLPAGRYLAFFRIKDTNQVSNDLALRVYNETDSRFLNEENDVVYTTATSSFAYYSLVFDITEDDEGDTLYVQVQKATANTNSIYVDYFLIVPITDGESLPQDLAHSAMRTFEKEVKVYPR